MATPAVAYRSTAQERQAPAPWERIGPMGRWLIGGLCGLVLFLFSLWMTNVASNLSECALSLKSIASDVSRHDARISVVESGQRELTTRILDLRTETAARIDASEKSDSMRIERLEKTMDRVEGKLDRVLLR